uniref:Uncharacterized protein n=1 Tax=Oryza brachyantha TaxID=4533 RepID=J3LEL7_ORYBR
MKSTSTIVQKYSFVSGTKAGIHPVPFLTQHLSNLNPPHSYVFTFSRTLEMRKICHTLWIKAELAIIFWVA